MKTTSRLPRALILQVVASVLAILACVEASPPEQAAAVVEAPEPAGANAAAQPFETLRWDFEMGDAGGWAGMNSEVKVAGEVTHGGSTGALRVDAGEWGANFQLESRELARARALSFQVWCELADGKSAAWPQLHVNGANTNQWIGPGREGSLEGGRWVDIRVDLTPFERPRSLTIQVWDAQRLYVDDITVEIAPAREVSTRRARVEVDTEKMLHEFAPDAHGTNLVALWNDTGDSPGAVRALSQMGLGLLRFPGGVPAHWYDWKDPLATGWTELTPERAWKMARAAGARMVFQTNAAVNESGVNDRTGTPYRLDNSAAHQAQWVSFARDKGIEVALWEIGNEPETDAPEELKKDQAAVYRWYNEVFEKQARAIKAVDPGARVLGPASTNTWFWWHEGNLAKFMKAHGDRGGTGLVDAVSVHWYPGGGEGPWEEKRGAAQDWAESMAFIRKVLDRHDSRRLPLYVTEWNWGGGTDNTSARELSNALGCADTVGMFLRSGVAGHTHFCLQKLDRNWGMLAMQDDSRPADQPSPTYFALLMAARLHGRILDVSSDADARDVLSVYGAEAGDGSVRVLMINKSGDQVEAALSVPGRDEARVETLQGLHDDIGDEVVIYNGVESPDPARADLPPPRLEPAQPTWLLPPYSITLITFP